MKIREGYYSEQIRNNSFKELQTQLNKRQLEVFKIVYDYQPIYSEKIAEILGVFPHEISPRILELRKMNLIEFAGESKSKTSGKKVSLWRIKISQGGLF